MKHIFLKFHGKIFEFLKYSERWAQKLHLENNYFKVSEMKLKLLTEYNSNSRKFSSYGNFRETLTSKYSEKICI